MTLKKQQRRRYSPEEKLSILKRHLVGKESVSDICDHLGLHPNQFYKWQSELFSNGISAFNNDKSRRRKRAEQTRIEAENARLRKELEKKDCVIAEITEDYVRLKKKSSDLFPVNG